jgi:hypothetical protein
VARRHSPACPPRHRPLEGSIISRLDSPALIEQTGRLLQVDTALPDLALSPERLVLREALT